MQLNMFSGVDVSVNREVAPVVDISKLSPQFNVEEEKHFYYVSGVLGMKNDGTFTDEKRHWMTFTRETVIPMQEWNEKPFGATQRGVFVGTESGARLKIAKPVTPQVPGGVMEKYIKVAADSIDQLRKVDVYRVLVESNRVEFRQAIASYIKSNRPDLIEEVDQVMMDADVGTAGQVAETKAVGLDEVRTEYPFGKALREDQFFGSRVRILSTGMKGDADWEGTVQSTLNGGRLFSVKRDGTEFSVRIGGDRIDVLERVEYGVEQNVVGAAKDVAALPDSAGVVLTAEQKIRLAFVALPSVTLGQAYPIIVEHNGTTRQFLACQKALATWNNKASIHLASIQSGKMFYTDEANGALVKSYTLNGKDVLSENRARRATEEDLLQWSDSGFENPVKKSQQSERQAFEHAGYQIYPLTRSDGREVWLLQSQDNKVAGKVGFGDEIYDAVEQAQKNAELQSRNAIWKAEIAAKVDVEAALAETARESNRGLSLSERKAKAVLEKDVSFGGKNMTLREVVEQLVASGAEVSSDEVDAIKPMSRMQFHRADQRQQDAHEKRVKEAGKKTLYYVGDYNLGKTAYDYACSLKAKDVPVAEVSNLISDPVTERIKRNNAREQQFNRDAQYQQLMLAKREDVQGIVDGMSVDDTQAALDRLNAAPGDNLPVRASLAVKLDRADKVAVEVLNSEVEQKDSTQVSKGEQVQLDSVCLLVKEFANKKLAMAAGELSNKNYTVRPCAEADVSKPWLLEVEWSRKSIASRYAEKLAEGRAGVSPEPSDYHYSFADHILNKDAYRLDHLANGLNDEGKRVFTAVTGVELPKQQGATWAAIREWGGISLEEDNKNKAWRQVVFERQKLEPKVGVDPLLWANDKVEKGFAELKKVGRETWLVHADGQGFNLSKKGTNQTMLVPYLEAKIKYEQARAACEPSVAAAVEGCVSEGTFSGAVLSVADGVAVQKISRDGATANHDVSKLSGKVAVGDVLDINYRDGVGFVGGKAVAVEVGR